MTEISKTRESDAGATVVLGATGLVGRALVARLIADGRPIVVVARDPAVARRRFAAAVPVRASLAAIGNEVAVDSVVNLAAASILARRWTPSRRAELLESRVAPAAAIAAWIATRSRRPQVVVTASSVSWYGPAAGPCDETAPAGAGFRSEITAARERAAATVARHGVRDVRLRLGIVLARDGGFLAALRPLFARGLGATFGDGRQPFAWIHLADVVALILRAIEDPRLAGPVNAVAPTHCTGAAFATAFAAALGGSPRGRLPAWILRAALGRRAEVLLTGTAAVPAAALAVGFRFAFPILEGALADLVAPSRNVNQGGPS